MRSEADIQDRIRFLLTQELDRRVVEACARLPRKCQHNHQQPLDVRKEIAGEPNESYNRVSARSLPVIGLCMLDADDPLKWKGTICEDPIDAQRCPYFTPTSTKETVREEFSSQLKDLAWVAENLPEVHGLLWALGSETMPTLPWWKKIWFRFVQIRPDPMVVQTPSLTASN